MMTFVPTGPETGPMLVITGVGVTVKFKPLLARPLTVTMTFPLVAPAGTVMLMLFAVQLETAAVAPLRVTVLVPCVAPKLEPLMVKVAPTGP